VNDGLIKVAQQSNTGTISVSDELLGSLSFNTAKIVDRLNCIVNLVV